LIHGGGSPVNLRARIAQEFSSENLDVIVYGHTHEAYIAEKNGCLWINPGSVSHPRSPSYPTVAVLRVVNDGLVGAIP